MTQNTNKAANIPNLYDILSQSRSESPSIVNGSVNNTSVSPSRQNSIVGVPPPPKYGPNPYTLSEFAHFLQRTHCDENLEFFQKTRKFLFNDEFRETYSNNSLSDHSTCSKFDVEEWNRCIYDHFIRVDSPMECNLPQYIRELFDKCYTEGIAPKQVHIVQAIQHILGLLFDAYARFLQQVQEQKETPPTTPSTSLQQSNENSNHKGKSGGAIALTDEKLSTAGCEKTVHRTKHINSPASRASLPPRNHYNHHDHHRYKQHENEQLSVLDKGKKFFHKFKLKKSLPL
ncbi:GTPase-activating protein RGS2 KNAG_0H03410 [Huiozyma naganishii CBS 8797]|uniref:RGS domain-containing protein n=1 Tax=Huiozyma naganishii (strain ATCC MYA-139 / BCRC 22969 / CBS 8797 / KCTC 17520 / NBRC 10181 / NCYC 3082 / Yp74L-3) TaxID=1071383 RepID=J7RA52_HUIN7|nr:hypothetical protein KNAG_0H03410 [Kazachstania naganishii CBS 8797]CCK71755.1 hypothetical protein KNAG_0H03410 [Kazachstania naganishii CBS 8797]